MRHLTSIADEGEARRFADYLTSIGIDNQADEANDGWALWIESDDDVDRARAELEQFRTRPGDPKYAGAVKTAKVVRAQEERRSERLQKNYVDVRTSWSAQSFATSPLTLTLIVVCLAVATLTLAGTRDDIPVYEWLAFTWPPQKIGTIQGLKAQLETGQVWRLITPMFMHYGPVHLIFNLFWLRYLGTAIERRKGALTLASIVILSALVGDVAQYFASGSRFGGMSGVVYGLFGYVWMKGKFHPSEGLGAPQQTVTIMVLWLVICFLNLVGDIANAAHLGGLIVGMVLGGGAGAIGRVRRGMRLQ